MNREKEKQPQNCVFPPASDIANEQSENTTIDNSLHMHRREMCDATQRASYGIPPKSADKLEQQSEETDVIKPHDNDVLTGRKFSHYVGNARFRDMCLSLQEEFKEANKKTKQRIAMDVVNRIKAESGRFLEQRRDTWHKLSSEEAAVKALERLKKYQAMKKGLSKNEHNYKRALSKDEFSNTIIEQLNGGKQEACLLGLAKFFRAKSSLLQKQAAKLDEIALGEDITFDGVLSPEDALFRKNALHYAQKTKGLLLAAHEKLDTMEDGFPPWEVAKKMGREMSNKRRKTSTTAGRYHIRARAYNIFNKENFEAFAAKCQSRSAVKVSKLASAGWKALTDAEKQPYIEKAVAARKQEQNQQSHTTEGNI
mmetsp:Transcript_7983/g.11539  ORF Transcript_7983/g.11539 Transcript_7983/m.11539 type:complete len:368 (-) Transcript_7983:268-1371(-)|eukprot:CAMPEP_0194211916 /NCGR_PEP_ID=MMETSP0156-20130528/11310_1 /TAXON_ID=33649 /ORGANISM="Thalassionema nitzschioides, Strain L26-B" /LENGTH=367 /DNA_ID=CAMNT_0038939605 /DNA_START=93 /DNA_END=1196 /DNA_ORIENTATION=+